MGVPVFLMSTADARFNLDCDESSMYESLFSKTDYENEDAIFIGGIAGFRLIENNNQKWPSAQATHGWTLLLEDHSQHRNKLGEVVQ